MPFLPIYIYFIALSFIASLTIFIRPVIVYKYLKLFPLFLLATFGAEFWGSYLYSIGRHNVFIYNFFTIVEFVFYLYVLRLLIHKPRVKNIIAVTIIAYILLSCINVFFVQGTKVFHTNSYSVGCLLIVLFCIYYFLELFRNPKSMKLAASPAFWICSGLLFFYCCSFPAYALFSFGGALPPVIVTNLADIFTVLNIMLYSLFTIAFLCSRNLKSTLSQQ